MKRTIALPVVALATAALLLAGCSNDEDSEPDTDIDDSVPSAPADPGDDAEIESEPGEEAGIDDASGAAPGRYVEYGEFSQDTAAFAESDVVLFFHASWCPKCRETEENINADGLADGLTVVKVDYDSSTDLRQQYGVTLQHTFVQIDESGAEVAKWNGSFTPDDIAAKTV